MLAVNSTPQPSHLKTVDPFEAVPYANPDLEKSLLGAILRYPGQFSLSLGALAAGYRPPAFKLEPWECFYDKGCGWIYQGLTALHEAGSQIDLPLLENWLIGNNPDRYSRPGLGRPWLREVYELGYAASAIEDASREILSAALRRWQEQELQKVQEMARDRSISCEDYNANLGSKLLEVTYSRSGGGAMTLAEINRECESKYEEYKATGMGARLVPTGFADLDEHLGGGLRAELIVEAGRPSMGKTTFAMNVVLNAASEGYASLIFSLEQPREQLLDIVTTIKSKIPSKEFSNPVNREQMEQQNPSKYRRLVETSARVANLPITIEDTPDPSIYDIQNTAKRWISQQQNPGYIVLDYLQLMGGDQDDRVRYLSMVTRQLQKLARELQIPVLALSQLSRGVESRTNKRPMMSDLRDSGSIEQDAATILMLYRDSQYNEEVKAELERSGRTDEAEVIMVKGRGTGTKTIHLNFHGPTVTFSDRAGGSNSNDYGDDY